MSLEMIHIYFGTGKGKTSILNGSVIRALGAGISVEYFRFFKNISSAEDKYLNSILKINFSSFYKSSKKFIWNMNKEEIKKLNSETLIGISKFAKSIKGLENKLVIADEILDAIINKIISDEELAFILSQKGPNVEIMMSGHILPKKCAIIANLISEVKCIKHYYNEGISIRKGIEL